MKIIIGFLVAMAAAAGGVTYFAFGFSSAPSSNFKTADVVRGDLRPFVPATGTLEPVQSIDVGAQVTGMISKFGLVADAKDPTKKIPVDFGAVVHKGDVLAEIDDRIYKAQFDQAAASLLNAQANLGQLEAFRVQKEQEWKRAKDLLPTNAIAATDYDLDVANYKASVANVEVGKAAIEQAKANLAMAQANLDYCFVRTPVDGLVVSRKVDIGQTVVSNMSASSLFLIGCDPKRIQPWASVNEADIGRIYVGQPVTFTVDAYPGQIFHGKVFQIRLNATMTQNVVTYTVVVDTDNSDGKLLYYMTSTMEFKLQPRLGVLQVPNAALRWKPRLQQIVPEARKASWHGGSKDHGKDKEIAAASGKDKAIAAGSGKDKAIAAGNGKDKESGKTGGRHHGKDKEVAKGGDRDHAKGSAGAAGPVPAGTAAAKPAGGQQAPAAPKTPEERGRIWVKDGDFVRPVDVWIGASDGVNTEVHGHNVQEGMKVVIGELAAGEQDSEDTNPFTFKMPGRGGRK
ncbi:MAG: efflux RND transporter periplasmic adaptor subunit [Thermoguttaceae bacterium]